MSKHTPGPWSIRTPRAYEVRPGCLRIEGRLLPDGTHEPIAEVRPEAGRCLDQVGNQDDANAALISAAPELLEALTMGVELNTPDFLDWLADRLVNVYQESENVDFVQSLRRRAQAGRAAIAKATGQASAPVATPAAEVVIDVTGGVADIIKKTAGVVITINDHDNESVHAWDFDEQIG